MRALTVFLITAAVVATANAGGNPEVRCYVDFDPPNKMHMISPEAGTTVDAYICLDALEMGVTCLSFRLTDVMSQCPGVFSSHSFENLLLGGITVGDPFSYSGVTVCGTECAGPGGVCVAVVHLEYVDGECCIEIEDHGDFPRWVVDCNDPGQLDYYEIGWHGSVGGACCPLGESGLDVRCEPQGSGNPSHPPTYWYDVQIAFMEVMYDFRVRVYDPNPDNYTNWVAPEEWTFGLEQDEDGLWAAWHHGPWGSYHGFRFQFDHPNPATWGHWEYHGYLGNPYTVRSADMPPGADGCGYRVHVPEGTSAAEQTTWGTIKALYR